MAHLSCPAVVQDQIERLGRGLQDVTGSDLVGVYVHGSLALGGFNPARSDIDLLVVVRGPLTVEAKRGLSERLLSVSGKPCPVELTVATAAALRAGEHPMALEFHYSEMWRRQQEDDLANGGWRGWNGRDLRDPDLAGQVAVARQHGIRLCGEPGETALPTPSPEHITASFMQDCEAALSEIEADPVYGVLNPLRTCFYLETGRLVSKAEAGQWAHQSLPSEFQPAVTSALARYGGSKEEAAGGETGTADALTAFADYLRGRIARHP